MRIHEWLPADINYAKRYFIEGLQIKDIAKKMNRTPTAINKALSRFNIRPKQSEKRQKPRFASDDQKYSLATKLSFEAKILQKEFDNWIGFIKLCDFLNEQKVCFFELTKSGTPLDKRQFKVDEKILSTQQLLMLANKIRLEKNLRPFFVRGISW